MPMVPLQYVPGAYLGGGIYVGSEPSTPSYPTYFDIRQAFVAKLLTVTELTDIVSTRIRPGYRPQDDPLPELTYRVVDNPPAVGVSRPGGFGVARITVDYWSRTLSQCVLARRAVRRAIHGVPATTWATLKIDWAKQVSPELDLSEPPQDATDRWHFHLQSTYWVKYRLV